MICCIDTSNIFFIAFGAFTRDKLKENGDDYVLTQDDLGLFYHMFIRKIMPYITSYKNIVFCFEGEHSTSYRKSVYPPYKENRKATKDSPNYKFVPELMENVISLLRMFNGKVLKVPYCEGDDCIYQTCKYYTEKGEQVRVVSNDKDLTQLMNYFEGVSQYNPIKMMDLEKNENVLLEKVIVGDTSDNIGGIPKIGAKTFEKMMNDKELYAKKMTPENLAIMENISKIVDLRKYPQQYQDAIKAELDKPDNLINKDGVSKFFLDHGLMKCFEDWGKWSVEIESAKSDVEPLGGAEDEIMRILG